MSRKFKQANNSVPIAQTLFLSTILYLALWSSTGVAAGAEPSDITFRSINGTTGQPCTLDRLLLQESTMTMDEVADTDPIASVFTIGGVHLVDARAYVVTAWFQEVPYFWEFRGRFIDQDTNTIHVFSTTTETHGVVVSGLNVILKKQGSLANLEYILQIDNRIIPQTTVVDNTATFELMFPSAATGIEAAYHRGPDRTLIETRIIGNNRLGLKIPLVPGINRIHIQAKMEWQPDLEIPVGSNLPIESWSLLGSPPHLEFQCFELEPDPDHSSSDLRRFIGPELEAGREVVIRVDSNPPPAPESNLFSDSDSVSRASKQEDTSGSQARRNPVPIPLLALAITLITLLVVIRLRRKGKSE
ncbi:MAG: hypothetical protein KOO60_12180 [Gemmatimonadales bacterium]|nr:hypothetical protein [Gemmatimonadales bacterium]